MTPAEFFAQAQAALALPEALTPGKPYAMGGTPAEADALSQLVLAGKKTATSSAFAPYVKGHDPLPVAGAVELLNDSHGEPVALLYTEDVTVRPFMAVDAEHARLEGEGDLSLSYWRRVHQPFFAQDYEEAGLAPFDPNTAMVVLERFRVLYPTKA